MAKKSNKSDKKSSSKFKDVSKPGETPDSSNARPTITGHNPSVKNDPMVAFSSKSNEKPKNDELEEEETKKDDEKKSYGDRSKARINPISKDFGADEEAEDKKDSDKDSDQKISPDDNTSEDTNKDDKAKQPEAGAEEKSSSVGSDSAAIDALAQTADAKKAESKQEEEEKKHQEYIDGLVKSGGYRLPIIEGGHKGSAERLISWIFFLLLIASVGVYLAIDGGYLDVGFEVPFEFIGN